MNVLDADGVIVASEMTTNLQGELSIPNVKPWWPYLMDPEPGYLYTLEVTPIRLKKTFSILPHGIGI